MIGHAEEDNHKQVNSYSLGPQRGGRQDGEVEEMSIMRSARFCAGKSLAWRTTSGAQVKTFRSELLGNRAGDNWQPLFAIAEAAGEAWLKETVQAAQQISRIKSFGRYLLESLGRIIAEKREKMNLAPTERIFLKSLDLVNELNQDKEAPWRDDKSAGGLTALQLSKALGAYDIKPEQVREAADRGRGYWSDGIENVTPTPLCN